MISPYATLFQRKSNSSITGFQQIYQKEKSTNSSKFVDFSFHFYLCSGGLLPCKPVNFLLHFYAIGVWIRSENRWVSFCPAFYKSQCFQASAAFITEAEILMKPARIRRYLISYISKLLYLQWFLDLGKSFRTNSAPIFRQRTILACHGGALLELFYGVG